MQTVLITGGAGFIGSHFADKFIENGDRVLIIDNLSTGQASHLNKACEFEHLDLDSPKVGAVMDSFRPGIIFHFAAQIDVRVSVRSPSQDAQQNIVNTLKLIEHGIRNNVGFFGFASSGGAIYGEPIHVPQGEDHPEAPLSPYGVAKLAIDKYLFAFKHHFGLHACSMRFANVYGPRQDSKGEAGVVSMFIKSALQGSPLRVNGTGLQTRDFVYVRDLAEAGVLIASKGVEGILNFGTGCETSVLDLARMVLDVVPGNSAIQHGPAKPGEQTRSVLGFQRANEVLGWTPKTQLRVGLEETAAWFSSESFGIHG
jgi:UDP-glucose 4-epimerase